MKGHHREINLWNQYLSFCHGQRFQLKKVRPPYALHRRDKTIGNAWCPQRLFCININQMECPQSYGVFCDGGAGLSQPLTEKDILKEVD